MTPNQKLFARVSIARVTGCKNMIISANIKIKSGLLMNRTDRTNNEMVRGCIIGTKEDKNLVNAISMVPNIDFYRYNLSFSLNKIDF